VISLTIYSRPGCHLCDDMKAVVQRVARALPLTPVTIVEIDISTDRELDEQYSTEIPVLLIEGKKVAKYRIGEDELRRILEARAGEAG
jgi:glutaredoxin